MHSAAISILYGILGGVWEKRWFDVTEENILKVRGKSAIRNMTLLCRNIAAMQRRVFTYNNYQSKSAGNDNSTNFYLEEVIERCKLLEEEVISAIEDWQDIIPQADVSTSIGMITELRIEMEDIKLERDKLAIELQDNQGKTSEEISNLKRKLEENNRKYRQMQDELRRKSAIIDTSGLGGVSGMASGSTIGFRTAYERSSPILPQVSISSKCAAVGQNYAYALGEPLPLTVGAGQCSRCGRPLAQSGRKADADSSGKM